MASDLRIAEAGLSGEVTDLERITGGQHKREPTPPSSVIIGLKKGTCGVLSKSIQIFFAA